MCEKYVKFNIIAIFIFIHNNMYFECRFVFVLNYYKDFILYKPPQSSDKTLSWNESCIISSFSALYFYLLLKQPLI